MTLIQSPRVIEKELSYNIIGCCFKTHKKLGRFAREKQYGDELEQWLKQMAISYIREYEIKNLLPTSPKGNRVDFFIEGKLFLNSKPSHLSLKKTTIKCKGI